jgi:glutathione S-transferase
MTAKLTLYHAAPSRSSTVLWMLEELGQPFELVVLDLKKGEQRQPAYLAVNPMGKVPAVKHVTASGDAVITESAAICTYLADEFPAAKLAPAIGDPLRGPYLRWMFFHGSAFEPAVIDHALKREPGNPQMLPYGDYETTLNVLAGALAKGPYLLGERFSAADVQMGSNLRWTMQFGIVPQRPEFVRYVELLAKRPALIRALGRDETLTPKPT